MNKKEEDFRTMAGSIILNPDEPEAQKLMLKFVKQYYPDMKVNVGSTGFSDMEDF